MIRGHLLDLNVLIALTEPAHSGHHRAHQWFHSSGKANWALCPFTEAGFLRVTTNPAFRPVPRSMGQATAILELLKSYPGYSFWKIADSWVTVTAPFEARISGHRQVTDAYLLGLAIKNEGVFVTFDQAVQNLAGPRFAGNVLVLS